MTPRELFVPATISKIHTYEPCEVRKIELTLPETYEVNGRIFPIRDRMHPGSAFLARPFGQRSGKFRRRMYTRSNCAIDSPLVLETIVNDTHREKADTSPWWQSEAIEQAMVAGETIEVRVDVHEEEGDLVVYENSQKIQPNNLILEPDNEWSNMRILALAFSTGITPFLSHIRYMQKQSFGQSTTCQGVQFILVVSVRNVRQLMEHEELQELAGKFPGHIQYYPVLTREWPGDWSGSKGRILVEEETDDLDGRINLDRLLALVPNVSQCHVRLCGSAGARDQLLRGLCQMDISPLSVRSEVW